MTERSDPRTRLTLRQLEVFVAIARGGTTRAAAGEIARSQSAASTALGELEGILGAQLFDRVGKRLVINENGRVLLPRAAALLEQALEAEGLFSEAHAAPLRLASSYTIGEYLLPELIASWKTAHPGSHIRLDIANTHDVFEAVSSFVADVGFIEGMHTHPELTVHKWLTDELVVVAAPAHPLAGARASAADLQRAVWVVREPGSGTREASDRWLIPHLDELDVGLELGSNEAIKRAVAAGIGLGCLSRRAVLGAIAEGWLVEIATGLPRMERTLSVVLHRSKRLGSAAEAFVGHCMGVGAGKG